jgi:ribosomal-protein-serine acetyltransferase
MFHYPVDDEVELRLFEMRHADELFALAEENREHLLRFLPWIEDIHSYIDTRQFIREGLTQFANNDGFQAGIWYCNALVGCIGYHSIDWANRRSEIGYWLDRGHQGRGIMTRSVRALTDYAFRVYGLNRVILRCAVENARSRAVAERLGFQFEGVLREDLYVNFRYVDHALYGMLAHEWHALNAPAVT